MILSPAGANMIRGFEDCRLTGYLDGGGVPTIGWGHTGPDVHPGMSITQAVADELFKGDVAGFVEDADAAIAVQVSQHFFDAFVSILYNVGPGAEGKADGILALKAGGPSTLLRLLNAGDTLGAIAEFARWHKDNGRRIGGLLDRRISEMAFARRKD